MADKTATLNLGGTNIDLPILTPTVGPECLDIRKLYAQGDVFTCLLYTSPSPRDRG